MCQDPNCPFREAARLAAQFSKCGIHSAKLALEGALRRCGFDIPQYTHLYQDKRPAIGGQEGKKA